MEVSLPLVFNLFVRCGPIFMKKLLNCVATSFFICYLGFIYIEICWKLFLYFGFVYNISYVFPCFPVIPVFTKLQVIISSLCLSF